MFLVAVRNFDSDLEALRWTTTSRGGRERPQKEIGYRTSIEMASLSLPIEEFSALCDAIVGREIRDEPQNRLARPGTVLMSRLMKLHNAIGRLAHDAPDIFDQSEVVRALEEKLIHVMIRCLAEGTGVETTTGCRRHDAIVSRFEQFLEANPDRPLCLTEICAAVGVAERTLRASCEEHLGMGPIRYLTLRRMHLVRRRLLRADASATNVTRIVTDHGFWELGRFSVAYRTLFGESPCETLRRPAQEAEIFFLPTELNRQLEPTARRTMVSARSPVGQDAYRQCCCKAGMRP
jgi:AraC-like DNA-binding protein